MTPLDPDVEREIDRIDKRLMAVEAVPVRLVSMEVEMRGLADDLAECRRGVGELRKAVERRAVDREKERKQDMADRKSDRRFMVTTILSAAAIVVVAVGIIVSAL